MKSYVLKLSIQSLDSYEARIAASELTDIISNIDMLCLK